MSSHYMSAVPPYRPVRIAEDHAPTYHQMNHVGPATGIPNDLPVIRPTPGRQWRVGPAVGYGDAVSAATNSAMPTPARIFWGSLGLLAFAAQVAGAYYGYQWGKERGMGVGVGLAGFMFAGAPVWMVGALAAPLMGFRKPE